MLICAFTFERWPEIQRAVESVRAQTVAAHEIVLVIDYAPELLDLASERWPDVRVVPNREKRGLSGSRNSGIAISSGDVVAFLDDDAVAMPDWLERLTDGYADRAVVGVGGAVRPDWTVGRPSWFPVEFDWVVGCSHSGMPDERSPVRNLIGANMSFRRDVLVEAGSFAHALGRVGTDSVGGDETELCIRVARARPEGLIVYDPAVSVSHVVPATRGRLRYFFGRCTAEGRSKALISHLVGTDAGLATERPYVRRTLPAGFLRGLREGAGGDPWGFARAAVLVVGLASTTGGYLAKRARIRRFAPRGERAERPLRVLFVTPRSPLGQGGVERHVREVASRIARAGAEIEIICANPGGPPRMVEEVNGVTITSVRAWPANRDYYFAPRIWREMASRPWDLVHIQSYHTAVAPLAMLRALTLGVPYVLTFHGGGHSSRVRNLLRGPQRRALRPLLKRAHRLVAVARFEIDAYGTELRLPRDQFVLIPNGTDPAPSANGEDASSEDVNAVLATIGRLERYKGHDRVIEALPFVLEHQPEAKLLVVGAGPYKEELQRQAARLEVADRVEFTSVPAGDRRGMDRLLHRVSLVVLLSELETHPLVALEAAAAGRRLLVADQGGLGELAADGLARPVAPHEGPAGIARAILETLAEAPPDGAPQLPSWDECAAKLLDLYGSVA